MRILEGTVSIVLIAGALGAAAQELDPSAYRPIPFSQILDRPRSAPPAVSGGVVTPGFLEDLVKPEATYTGNRRAPQTDPRLMEAWVLARHLKPDAAEAFPAEYEFADGGTVAWVRMFFWVSPDGVRPVKTRGQDGALRASHRDGGARPRRTGPPGSSASRRSLVRWV
jgi:hypothetical protein